MTNQLKEKKTDSAHPSIYPTGDRQTLSGEESKIYDLIAKRFLALFCEDAIIENKKIKVIVENKIFAKRGSAIRKKSWLEFYPSKMKEEELPDLTGKTKVIDSRIEEKETQPPKRYSPASIISELEKRNLGTKATRSSILETLYDRGYIQDKNIKATALGISLISTLEKYSPIIIDDKLTRNFEQEMEIIEKEEKNLEEKKLRIIEKAKKIIRDITKDFEKYGTNIGKELIGAQDELIKKQKEENKLNECPICKKGNLRITYSPKTRRYFISCDQYPNCTNTYPLPPNGMIKKTDKVCEKCGFPMLTRLSKGKRPWTFCFNLKCPTNAEWVARLNERNQK
jgi:DNA topoisomerase I